MEVLGGEDEYGNNVDGKQDSVLGQTYVQNLRKIRAEMKAILDKNEREKEGSMPKFMCVQNFQLYQPVVLRK